MEQANQHQQIKIKIKILSDTQLLEHLQRLFNYEKKLNQALLLAIAELNQRKIFLEMGYSSLFDMLVRHFHLSESSAYQKISTMKLMMSVPKTQELIHNGNLSLTNAAMAQSFIAKVEKTEVKQMTVLEKQNIISAICHKTQKEAQAILAAIHPVASLPNSREKQITADHTQIQILLNKESYDHLNQLKTLYSHKIPDGNLNQLFSLIIEFAFKNHPMNLSRSLKRKQPTDHNSMINQSMQNENQTNADSINHLSNQNLPVVQSNENQNSIQYNVDENLQLNICLKKHKNYSEQSKLKDTRIATNKAVVKKFEKNQCHINNKTEFNCKSKADTQRENESVSVNKQNQRTTIPISTKRIIFTHAQGQCEYRAPNGQRCQSHHQLEFDHKQSVSLGGTNSIENLQLLCRLHNQYKVKVTHGFIYQKRKNEII